MSITVTFYMWGQRCQTEFADIKEALRWLGVCYDKGWLQPAELVLGNGVVMYDEGELVKMVAE